MRVIWKRIDDLLMQRLANAVIERRSDVEVRQSGDVICAGGHAHVKPWAAGAQKTPGWQREGEVPSASPHDYCQALPVYCESYSVLA